MTVARTGRRMKMSVKVHSFELLSDPAACGFGRSLRRLNLVIDLDRRAVAQFDLAAGHDLSPSLTPERIGDLIAARLAGGDESSAWRPACRRVLVVDQINRVAIGVIGDRGLRQRDLAAAGCADIDGDRARTCRAAILVGIFEGRAHLHVAGRFVDLGLMAVISPVNAVSG